MSDHHGKHFQRTLWDIRKRWGQHAITSNIASSQVEGISTGFTTLDDALHSGGIGRGRLTALTGVPTSGMTTLALRIIRHAQRTDGAAVYLDTSGVFDADYAARCGVDLERLLIVQPGDMTGAVTIMTDLLRVEPAIFLVLDSVGASSGNLSTKLVRPGSLGAVLVLASHPSASLGYAAHTCLHVDRIAWLQRHGDITGCRTCIRIRKDRPDTGEKHVIVEIDFPTGTEGERL